MTQLDLHIDEVVIETEVDKAAAEQIPEILRLAFLQCTELLQSSMGSSDFSDQTMIERLQIDMIPSDELLGPRGAARLAEEMYRAIVASRRIG